VLWLYHYFKMLPDCLALCYLDGRKCHVTESKGCNQMRASHLFNYRNVLQLLLIYFMHALQELYKFNA